ncbi:MAG TPA: alpha/beta fold hydrolase [Candidatus Acidoferrum sp.]|nr:alpha/beta fold hydrolase [Candidatus Acidoferrum sp.]
MSINVLAYRHAYAMTHFTSGTTRTDDPERLTAGQKLRVLFSGPTIPRPRTRLLPACVGPQCRSLSLPGTNGIRLGAWYCPGQTNETLVILFHGYIGEKSGTSKQAKALLELGCSVLLVDFRGSGDSSASYTTVGYAEAEDVAAAVRYAREHLPHSKLILYGESMGAAAVLRAVHCCDVRADGIIAEAVFDRMLTTVEHRFQLLGVPSFPGAELLVFWGGRQFGFNGFRHNPVDYAASVTCPILFLHGAADNRAHVEEGRHVFAAVPGPKSFVEFPALGHAAAVARYREKWKAIVGQFLRALERNPSGPEGPG